MLITFKFIGDIGTKQLLRLWMNFVPVSNDVTVANIMITLYNKHGNSIMELETFLLLK